MVSLTLQTKTMNSFSYQNLSVLNTTRYVFLPGAKNLESLRGEITNPPFNEGYVSEEDYPFTIKPTYSILQGNIENWAWYRMKNQSCTRRYFLRILGCKPKVIHEESNISNYPVDILSFDNVFLEIKLPLGKIIKVKDLEFLRTSLWT